MSWLAAANVALELIKAAVKFNRKRAPGQEDHYFPAHPEQLNLRPGQCYHCRQWYSRPYPRRGCLGRPATLAELP